jgi:hypothetical protein
MWTGYPIDLWTVPLTGNEFVTIQPGSVYQVSISLQTLANFVIGQIVLGNIPLTGLPTALPASSGILWNNGGVLSIS